MQLRHLLRAAALPAALGLSMIASTAVFAAEPAAAASVAPATTVVTGTGRLSATGAGTIRVRGTFMISGRLDGGTIRIDGLDRFAAIRVNGWRTKTRIDRASVIFRGVHGTFSVADRTIRVTVVSPRAHVVAIGTGAAWLKGIGTYTANGHGPLPWTSAGAWFAL